jgi:hypothetical protein
LTAIEYTPPATLRRMLRSNAFARVAKGPVGSGKSSACVMEILRRATEQAAVDGIRRTRFAIIRNTYRELRDTTRRTFEQWIPAQIGKWREADFAFDISVALADGTRVESEILFRSLNRPEDVKKLLSLEITGAYVNELKEIPKRVIDVLETRVGRFPSKVHGGPTWFGWWADTNPWHIGHWGQKLFKQPPPGYELYPQPGGRSPRAENTGNLPDGYYERLCYGKDAEWIRVYIDGEDAASDVGSIYGTLLEKYNLEDFEHPRDGVFCSYDLGFTDSTAVWFWRINSLGGLDFVDHYESHGQPLSHYFDVIDQRGYQVVKHWLPHDAAARTLASGTSVQDQFLRQYPGRVQIGPALSLLDGIQAARWLLEQKCRFHPRTGDGVEALRSYHYEWDADTKSYSRKPEHDWSSHTADAFRYAAVVAKVTMNLMRKPAPAPAVVIPSIDSFTLDQLWKYHDEEQSGRERI